VAFYNFGKNPDANFNPSLLILIAYVITLFLTCALPLYYAHRFDVLLEKKRGTFAQFMSLLDLAEFRDDFHGFLTKRFCQENLQFYEVVTLWKSIAEAHPKKRQKALSILEVFVSEQGICQVHIDEEMKAKIMRNISLGLIPEDLFDEALEQLLADMYNNYFSQFWSIWTQKVEKREREKESEMESKSKRKGMESSAGSEEVVVNIVGGGDA